MKNKYTLPAITFFAGAVIGALIYGLSCCWCSDSCNRKTVVTSPNEKDTPGFGPTQVTVQKANECFNTYYPNAISVDSIKGFSINLRQFNAMQMILNNDPSVTGFRIYFGVDSTGPVRLVVGFGSPDHTDDIYETSDENSGPCPDMCDLDSPITQN